MKAVNNTNPTNELILCLNLPNDTTTKANKMYVVYSNKKTTSLNEVDIVSVTSGKTKYLMNEKKLIQSKRFILNEAPYKVDLFGDEEENEQHYVYDNDEKWHSSYFCFFDKEKAIEKLNQEKNLKYTNQLSLV